MKKIQIVYDHKTASGNWLRYDYITDNGEDWERVVNIIHQNPEEYKIIKVQHVG